MGIRYVFLPNCPLVLSLHKRKGIEIFLNKKNKVLKQKKSLK